MQISLKWIEELVNLETINLQNLIDKLTLGGFEVEEVLEIEIENQKTVALDISATANRSDSLSIQGLSLEIAALLNDSPKVLDYSTQNCSWSQQLKNLSITSLTEPNCSKFIALTIENCNNFTSPKWLKQKLIASGISTENNLLDFQNYILLETGYPLESYDLDQIQLKLNNSQFQLNLTSTESLTAFLANNESNYSLNNSILILKANDVPISIAGIIPSKYSSYSTTTKSLLIEGSIFNAAKIRQQSRFLGLRTNRSSRYEKSLEDTNLLEALYRFISLLRIANPKLVCKLHTISDSVHDPIPSILLDYETVKKVLGPIKKLKIDSDNNKERYEREYISPKQITDSLERLKFKVNFQKKNTTWKVRVPSLRRNDIVREIDLIEEISRIYGFNNFLTRLPTIQRIGLEDFDYQTRKKLTSCLINLGLNELIQYSLVNETTYFKNDKKLVNPLVTEYSTLRSSLLPNLLKSVEENFKNSNSILEGFEYGHVFSDSDSSIVHEKESVAGIFGGIKVKSNWSDSSKFLDWFEAKGKMEQIFQKLSIITYWKSYNPRKEKTIFHPYCTAEIYLMNGRKLGIFGQVSPILAKKLNLLTDIYLFELDFEEIKNQLKQNKLAVYQEYSLYPKIVKDLSFILNNDISFRDLKKILYFNGSQFLKTIHLLDEYRGNSIPENHTSLCFQLIFQSDKETLQNKKVEAIIDNLKNLLITKFNVTIRI